MSKRQKVEDSVNSSSDEEMDHEDIDWNSRVDQELDFEFQLFRMVDSDFHSIKMLLQQNFTRNSPISLSDITDAIIKQDELGVVLKQDDNDGNADETVYALMSCYSLTRAMTSPCLTAIRNFFINTANSSSSASKKEKDAFIDLMKNSASVNGDTSKCQYRVGYFINEKFLNIPFDTVGPRMLDSVMSDINKMKMARVRHDFTHYVMVCQINKEKNGEVIYSHPEEFYFAAKATLTFDFQFQQGESGNKNRKMIVLEAKHFDDVVAELMQS